MRYVEYFLMKKFVKSQWSLHKVEKHKTWIIQIRSSLSEVIRNASGHCNSNTNGGYIFKGKKEVREIVEYKQGNKLLEAKVNLV